MKIGDVLLKQGYINNKQLEEALVKQNQEKILYNKDLQLGKILIDEGFVSLDDLTSALTNQAKTIGESSMPTEIGEKSKFTFDLKFVVTILLVVVSATGTYFGIQGSISELKSNNSPNRLEYDYLKGEVDGIKSMGDLKIITYKLDEYDEMFKEIKELVKTLSPLASDLEYIKKELNKLKNINIPEVDLSGLELKLDKLSSSIRMFEERLIKLESKSSTGGRF